MNHKLIKSFYEVRGATVIRADEIKNEIKDGKDYPFKDFIQCNIGNPQAVGQKAITFPREVMGCLLSNSDNNYKREGTEEMKTDIVARAKQIKTGFNDNLDKLTSHRGNRKIRKKVANFIMKRDGVTGIDETNIMLSNGASTSIKYTLKSILSEPTDAVIIMIILKSLGHGTNSPISIILRLSKLTWMQISTILFR